MKAITTLIALCVGISCAHSPTPYSAVPDGKRRIVVTAHPLATRAGLAVLDAGGSAVDAAVAVQAMLTLVEPQSSGLGGGAFMLYFDESRGEVLAYDGRESAPAAADPEMFLSSDGTPMEFLEARTTGTAVGVPGVLAMLHLAHSDHGRLPWAQLFEDAITRAAEGFPLTPRPLDLLERLHERGYMPLEHDATRYLSNSDGMPLKVGHVLKNPLLAETFEQVAADWRAFYEGPVAEAILKSAQREPFPSPMTAHDLRSYKARRTDPLCVGYREHHVCGMPSPSSGGLAVGILLGLLNQTTFAEGGSSNPHNWFLFTEASMLAYADRDRYAGDERFVDVPVDGLLSVEYLNQRARLIDPTDPPPPAEAGDPWPFDGSTRTEGAPDLGANENGTSHFVIVDEAGNVVSMTTSVEAPFGSLRMAGGMVLNNQLTDFSFQPQNEEGLPIPNAVAGGKRPRSSMSPTIVLNSDGTFRLATGSAGGARIIAYVAKTLIAVLDWGMPLQNALDLANVFAHPKILKLEDQRIDPELRSAFESAGYTLGSLTGEESGLHAVLKTSEGDLIGAADSRREGTVGR